MSVVFWIEVIFLVLVFIVSLCNSVDKNRHRGERQVDLAVAVVTFVLLLMMNNVWR